MLKLCTRIKKNSDLADTSWDLGAISATAGTSATGCTLAKTSLCESSPDGALVDTTGECSISVNDSVTSLDEGWVTWLSASFISIRFITA